MDLIGLVCFIGLGIMLYVQFKNDSSPEHKNRMDDNVSKPKTENSDTRKEETTIVSQFNITFYEHPIIEHLKQGGSTDDSICNELINEFLDSSLQNKKVKEIIEGYGFDRCDVFFMYSEMIDYLMPNPCIFYGGGPMLVATYPYSEHEAMKFVLDNINNLLKNPECRQSFHSKFGDDKEDWEFRNFVIEITSNVHAKKFQERFGLLKW